MLFQELHPSFEELAAPEEKSEPSSPEKDKRETCY